MSTSRNPSTTASAASTPAGTDPLPTVWCPDPPAGFTPTKGLTVGSRPLKTQVETAPKVALELRATALYRTTFGATAPDPTTLATVFSCAGTWSNERVRAEAWLAYVKEQEVLSWRFVLSTCSDMLPEYNLAVVRQPTQVGMFPALARFFKAPKVQGKRAAGAKARNQKAAKGAATSAPATATATATDAGTTPANPTSAPAATTPTKA